jgi:hypothetical protein
MSARSYIQWKIAMARMQDANLAAAEINPTKSALAQRATRNIAEQDLDSYFEMVEAELNHRRKLYAAEWGVITPE